MAIKSLAPEVRDFDRVAIRIHNHLCRLNLSQGTSEALRIRGPARLLDRLTPGLKGGVLHIELAGSLTDRIGDWLTTSLTRQSVQVDLTIRELAELDLAGLVQGTISPLKLEQLVLRFTGIGRLEVADLQSDRLLVELKGSPFVDVSGAVSQHWVAISGMGQYRAGNLKSQKTWVQLSGSGAATVWAAQELDVELRGMGSVEYYGNPRLKRHATGMTSLRALGAH